MPTSGELFQDYRDYLREDLARAKVLNPTYSLRAFAKKLQLSPTRLSSILNRRFGLSRVAAEKIASQLKLDLEEREYFCDLVESEHGRNANARQLAKIRIRNRSKAQFARIDLDSFSILADWYHLAILEYCGLDRVEKTIDAAAKALKIDRNVCAVACARLIRVGMLSDVDGVLTPKDSNSKVSSKDKSTAIRKFHSQILDRALHSAMNHDVTSRILGAVVFKGDSSKLSQTENSIVAFRKTVSKKMKGKNDKVFCLSVQLFPLEGDEK